MRLRATLLAAFLLVAASTADAARAPRLTERCLTKLERRQAVSFRASDGVRLAGVVVGRGSTGVVLGHEYNADLCNWMPFARLLAKTRYRVLAFDSRNFGSSARAGGAGVWRVDRDFAAGAKLLRARGARRVAFVGASMGGTAALVAAARVPNIAAVASLSGPTDFSSLDARTAVPRLRTPTLFLVGREDSGFAEDAQTLYTASAAPDKQLEVRPGGAHGTALLRGADGSAVRAILVAFLAARAR